LDAIRCADASQCGEPHPASVESLDDNGVGRHGEADHRGLIFDAAVEAQQAVGKTNIPHHERGAAIGEPPDDVEGRVAEVEDTDRSGDVQRGASRRQDRPIPRRDPLVGVGMTGVVELSQHEIAQCVVAGNPDGFVTELVA
jgi:hypothetical protein